ncbi:MAG: 16S rRNA (guanine(527)-N(7))-methyltransferase RsmG [Lentisphaerales bacterium]|nr:16S rRNA (guanine(527)-N(7))-methyltransferase RsmG [Lentisphaerales bacterium]
MSQAEFVEKAEQLFAEHTAINEIHNLTRIVTPEEFFEKHIVDSLIINLVKPELKTEPFKIADIGSGGGFPCLPLGMINSLLDITGIESLGKKVSAVNTVAEKCSIKNVKVEKYRAREAAREERFGKQFDVVTARAVASVEILIKECRNLLKDDGVMLFYKTPDAIEKEMPLALRDSKKFKFSLSVSEKFTLSEESGQRQFFILTKNL